MQYVPECMQIHDMMLQYSCRMFQNACRIAEWSRMFKHACRMFQNACSMFQNAYRSMILYAITKAWLQLHKLACSYIGLHAVIYKLTCSSFLRLSSSQEFRSACFFFFNEGFPNQELGCWNFRTTVSNYFKRLALQNLIFLIKMPQANPKTEKYPDSNWDFHKTCFNCKNSSC